MNAGRDLDALVALKVMGFTVYHYDKDVEANCYYMLMDGNFEQVVPGWREGERTTEEEAWNDVPLFSESILAAWQVVEKMKQRGWTYVISDIDKPHVEFHKLANETWTWANGTTVTEAICLTALQTVDGRV